MPQYFARHGYRTESLGKVFHIGHGNQAIRSRSVSHFDKVIRFGSQSTAGGHHARAFTNQSWAIRATTRGGFEAPEAKDDDYADGRVAAETIRRLEAAKVRRVKMGRRSLSRPVSCGCICRFLRRKNTGICLIPPAADTTIKTPRTPPRWP